MSLSNQITEVLERVFADQVVPGYRTTVDVVLRNVSSGAYDPATGVQAKTTQDIAVKAIFQGQQRGERSLVSANIQEADGTFFVRVSDVGEAIPSVGWNVVFGPMTYRVTKVEPIISDGAVLLWRIAGSVME